MNPRTSATAADATDATSDPLPSVTAVIATKGRPELVRAIDAIVDHDYAGVLDVIVVFDHIEPDQSLAREGGPDGDRRVRVTVNDRTPGLAGGRNTGILLATGDLVAFCDDDDEWRPGKLDAQVAALRANPKAHLAVTATEVHYRDRRRIRVPDPAELTFDGFLHQGPKAHPSSYLFERRFLLEEFGLVDEGLPGSLAEDYDTLLRVSRLCPIAVVPEPYVTIHWGPASFFSRRWQMTYDALEYLLAKYPEFAQHPDALARVRGQQAFNLAALGRRRESWNVVREVLRLRPTERRAYLALIVSTGLLSGERAMRAANWFGRGI